MKLLLALAVLAGCASAPACPIAPRPAGPTQPFLWKVQKGDGPIVWLYGTIHNAGEGDVPQAAWTALDAAPRLVSELGDTEPDPEQTGELALLPPGKGLDQQLPANDWYDLRDALRGSVKEAVLARARPWYAMARLTAKVAPSPSPTMDFAMAKRARAKGKPVDALESWEVQLAALADAVKLPDLQQALHERATMKCTLDTMKATYLTGDLPAMTARLVIPQTHKLVVDRSKSWVPKLEAYFASGGAFVAVGLGHMLGDEGLPVIFEKAGYRVSRVP